MKDYKILKIITAILYIMATVLAVVLLIDPILSAVDNQETVTIIALIFLAPISILAYAVPTLVSLIGAISAGISFARKTTKIGNLIYFIVFTALPYFTFYLIIQILSAVV